MRLAVLSNVNISPIVKQLEKSDDIQVFDAPGYGNEIGTLYDEKSAYNAFAPDITFLIMDLMELLGHDTDFGCAADAVKRWFGQLSGALRRDRIYYISDAFLWGPDILIDGKDKFELEMLWHNELKNISESCSNVRFFPYRHIIETLGEEHAFSLKMWYMGKIIWSGEAMKMLSEGIAKKAVLEERVPKKALLIDLDNTLWGGLAGENDITPVKLSEEHSGLAYKNLQRVILSMKKQGVILGIVSKNNYEDAAAILDGHPHMVLRAEDFAVKKINWAQKDKNILEIARELNLGLDSFVFFDDNEAERELVKTMLPQVEVPDFPDKPEDLANCMKKIFHDFFEKAYITDEDKNKTEQYVQNAKREELLEGAASFEDYLKSLEIVLERVDAAKNSERALQLVNKTNQFNLTTKRYDNKVMSDILSSDKKKVFLYRVADKFGDSGIVAVVIVDLDGEAPFIEEFAMSCRVMGRRIEHDIAADVEKELSRMGYKKLKSAYIPTAKNKPVERLYDELGYIRLKAQGESGIWYEKVLQE